MTFKGFIRRLAVVVLLTWIIRSFTDSWGWALFLGLLPIAYYEMLRSR